MTRVAALAALPFLGFACWAAAWTGLSTETIVAQQAPWLISGGLTGAGLIVLGCALLSVQGRRRRAAVELHALEEATAEARLIAAGAQRLRRR